MSDLKRLYALCNYKRIEAINTMQAFEKRGLNKIANMENCNGYAYRIVMDMIEELESKNDQI